MVDLSSVRRLHYLHNHAIKAKQVRFQDGCHQLHRVDIGIVSLPGGLAAFCCLTRKTSPS
ncbi:hypothetical protein ACP70R_048876 [Stipagrostis hirtigluma subsp. patula]